MKNLILSIAMCIIATPVFASEMSEESCLATSIYYESKSESIAGKIEVAQVVLNRVNSMKFPSSICSVVYQRTRTKTKTFCQFSWSCTRSKRPLNKTQYAEALQVATAILSGEVRGKYLNALFFQEKSRPIPKGRKLLGTMGNHVFLS